MKIFRVQNVNFLPERRTRAVSNFPVGSQNGRQVVTNCDGRARHSREGREI